MSIYIEHFFFALNYLSTLNILKETLGRKYNFKDLKKIQIIIK